MDVYQKLLLKVYEQAGGKDSENVDFTDLVKREGFYPSLPGILDHFLSQIWITQSAGKNVRLTHWGVAEAKKLQSSAPLSPVDSKKEINRLIAETREFMTLLEIFAADVSKDNLNRAAAKFSELDSALEKIKLTVS